jgi:hypothetical protein
MHSQSVGVCARQSIAAMLTTPPDHTTTKCRTALAATSATVPQRATRRYNIKQLKSLPCPLLIMRHVSWSTTCSTALGTDQPGNTPCKLKTYLPLVEPSLPTLLSSLLKQTDRYQLVCSPTLHSQSAAVPTAKYANKAFRQAKQLSDVATAAFGFWDQHDVSLCNLIVQSAGKNGKHPQVDCYSSPPPSNTP